MSHHRRKHDPEDALELATSAARLLGVVLLGFGLTIVIRGGYLNPYRLYRAYFLSLGLIVWVVPGVLLIMSSFYLRRRRLAALRVAQITTLSEIIFALALFAANFYFTPISAVPIVLCILWLGAMVALAIYLRRASPVVRFDADFHHGFEPITPQPVLPAN
ncbi:MAG TPA: hypothetical protein VL282_05810, partial [Tepidisphaeraceae bacterium]|nr:hypothetical protein [Tepidisphaeraceae bacterium]